MQGYAKQANCLAAYTNDSFLVHFSIFWHVMSWFTFSTLGTLPEYSIKMIAHIHKSGQTSWDKFVPSQETNYVVYCFLSVLKFWLNLFKTMPEWLLPWPVDQWPNRDNNEDQNSYLLFIRIWVLLHFLSLMVNGYYPSKITSPLTFPISWQFYPLSSPAVCPCLFLTINGS